MKKSINHRLLEKIEQFAPLRLAEKWDNVGMLIEPEIEVKVNKVLVTNDLTLKVMDEAIKENVQMIISYHPPIFNALKHIKPKFWKELIAAKCIKHDIYVYSPHTAFDSVCGGINDWILTSFDVKNKEPIEPYRDTTANNNHIESLGDTKLIHGSGRFCELNNPISLSTAIDMMKNRFKLKNLLLARSRFDFGMDDLSIKSIALCPGSGASLLKTCAKNADLWITGEMSHHDLLDATENIDHPTSVILTAGHSNSERGFLGQVFQPWLKNELQSENVEILLSREDADPLVVV